jgi:hypothetical protein
MKSTYDPVTPARHPHAGSASPVPAQHGENMSGVGRDTPEEKP